MTTKKETKDIDYLRFLVLYSSNDEVLVCTLAQEKKMLKIFFSDCTGRNLEDYDRQECFSGIASIETGNLRTEVNI